MNIGNQIKALRLRRGVTQEAMAQHFGITSQAVSKWECGTSVPDIGMLPDLSTYFGVTIDELFALSDETRIDRLQNMLWDLRFLDPADVENERRFLLNKAEREPENGDPHCMLAQIELHLAKEHMTRAEEYALEIMRRCPDALCGMDYLAKAMGGDRVDPRHNTHNRMIAILKDHVAQHPEVVEGYAALITQLIDDRRLKEARHYCERMAQHNKSFFTTAHWAKLAIAENNIPAARAMWEQMGRDYPDNWGSGSGSEICRPRRRNTSRPRSAIERPSNC